MQNKFNKPCKDCNVLITENNCVYVDKGKYIRKICRKCRSSIVMNYAKVNSDKRKVYVNLYARKTGRVKQYPCETCAKPCYKTYIKAFCSIKCRFLSYVEKTKECWIWLGGKGRRGYGKFSFNKENKYMPAHRASYILFKGEIPENMFMCHSCDNPPCVNPDHLWYGTNKENQIDSIKKGRHRWQKLKETSNASL